MLSARRSALVSGNSAWGRNPLHYRRLFGRSASSGVESMNNANKFVRSLYIPRAFMEAVKEACERHSKNLKHAAMANIHELPSTIKSKVNHLIHLAHRANVDIIPSEQNSVEAVVFDKDRSKSYRVNLNTRSCDCGHWQLQNFPCHHAARLCNRLKLDIQAFVDRSDCTQKYKAQYDNLSSFYIPTTAELNTFEYLIGDPIIVPPPRGRPPKSRVPNFLESRKNSN